MKTSLETYIVNLHSKMMILLFFIQRLNKTDASGAVTLSKDLNPNHKEMKTWPSTWLNPNRIEVGDTVIFDDIKGGFPQ